MNAPVDLLRSFAASVSLTLGLARLAEKLDPSARAVAAAAAESAATRTVLLSYPSSVPEHAVSRGCLITVICSVPVRTAQLCSPCEAPSRTAQLSVAPCHTPARAS